MVVVVVALAYTSCPGKKAVKRLLACVCENIVPWASQTRIFETFRQTLQRARVSTVGQRRHVTQASDHRHSCCDVEYRSCTFSHAPCTHPNYCTPALHSSTSSVSDYTWSSGNNNNNNTHLTVFFPRTTLAGRKDKPFWIFLKQRRWGGSDISWTICKSNALRSSQITMPAPH